MASPAEEQTCINIRRYQLSLYNIAPHIALLKYSNEQDKGEIDGNTEFISLDPSLSPDREWTIWNAWEWMNANTPRRERVCADMEK